MNSGFPIRDDELARIALVNPPFLPDYSRGQRSPAVTRSGTLYYPMWLAYAAAFAESLGAEVFLTDSVAERISAEETITRIREFQPHIVLVEAATPSIESDLGFCDGVKAALPEAMVFPCGTHVSALPEESLRDHPRLDGVILGEYEIPLGEAIKAARGKVSLDSCEGIHIRGQAVRPRTVFLEDLDFRPFVSEIYSRFLPVERYFNPNAHHPMVTILTGRGCPFFCSFCVFPQTLTGRAYRRRSLESILAEFQWVASKMHQVRGVFIEDDTFTVDRKRVQEFSRRLEGMKLDLSWTANARADVDLETLETMKRSNLRGLCVGFESGSQLILDRVGKNLSLGAMETFAENARRAGVHVHGCFVVGLPGETRATLQETLQFALRLPLDTAQFYPLMVYPGTRAYREADEAGLITARRFGDWLTPEGQHNCVVRTGSHSAAQLVRFCNLARRRFYLRKKFLWEALKRFLTEPDERHRLVRSAKTFLKHLFGDR